MIYKFLKSYKHLFFSKLCKKFISYEAAVGGENLSLQYVNKY